MTRSVRKLPDTISDCSKCPYRETKSTYTTSGVIGIPHIIIKCKLSGQKIDVFMQESFPEHCPLYVVNGGENNER